MRISFWGSVMTEANVLVISYWGKNEKHVASSEPRMLTKPQASVPGEGISASSSQQEPTARQPFLTDQAAQGCAGTQREE